MVEAGRQGVTTGGYDHNRILRFPFERTADGEVKTGGYDARSFASVALHGTRLHPAPGESGPLSL
jgi:hypothetical protein